MIPKPAQADTTLGFFDESDDGAVIMLFSASKYTFLICSGRQRTYLYAKANGRWTQVARATIRNDTQGVCDIDYPYLHSYVWRPNVLPPKIDGTRWLELGVGTSPTALATREWILIGPNDKVSFGGN